MYSYASKSNSMFSDMREAHDNHPDAVSVNEDNGDADDSIVSVNKNNIFCFFAAINMYR